MGGVVHSIHQCDIQWNCNPKDIILPQFRLFSAVEFRVMIEIAHTGSELVGIANVAEKRRDDGILRVWLQIVGGKDTDLRTAVCVLDIHTAALDDEFRLVAARILAVNERVRDDFTRDDGAQTFPLVILKIEFIGQIFLRKCHETFVALDQIGADDLAVIVAFRVHPAQQCICDVCRCHVQYHLISSEQHDSGEIVALRAGHTILAVEAGAL